MMGEKFMKNTKTPIVMNNGVKIHTLKDLQNNWDLPNMIKLWESGELHNWLKERYYEYEFDEVSKLDKNMPDFNSIFSEIFDMDYFDDNDYDEEEVRNTKLEELKGAINDEVMEQVDIIAFDQRELKRILAQNSKKVFLYNNNFELPLNRNGIEYIILGKSKITNLEDALNSWKLGYIKISGLEDYSTLIGSIERNITLDTNPLYAGFKKYEFNKYARSNGRGAVLRADSYLSENEAYDNAYNEITFFYSAWQNSYFNENDIEYKKQSEEIINFYQKEINESKENLEKSLKSFKESFKEKLREIKDEHIKTKLFEMVEQFKFEDIEYKEKLEELIKTVFSAGKARFLGNGMSYYINRIYIECHEGVFSTRDGKTRTRYSLGQHSVFDELNSLTDIITTDMTNNLFDLVKSKILSFLSDKYSDDVQNLKSEVVQILKDNQPIKVNQVLKFKQDNNAGNTGSFRINRRRTGPTFRRIRN